MITQSRILHSSCRSVVGILVVRPPYSCGLKLKPALSISSQPLPVRVSRSVFGLVTINESNHTPLVHARGLHKSILSKRGNDSYCPMHKNATSFVWSMGHRANGSSEPFNHILRSTLLVCHNGALQGIKGFTAQPRLSVHQSRIFCLTFTSPLLLSLSA